MSAQGKIPTVSTSEGLSFGLEQMLPNYLGGLFTPNPFWFGFWNRVHSDPAGVQLIGQLRRKYQSDYLYIKLLGKKSLLVLGQNGIRQVLDNSPELFAEPKIKQKGMSHFQPNAVTISRGRDWQDRRKFNEAVLASDQPQHPHGEQFLQLINAEVEQLQKLKDKLVWEDFSELFQRITLQVIFGTGFTDTRLTQKLQQLMRTANRGFLLKKSDDFADFYRQLRVQLKLARPGSLAESCSQTASTDNTRVENQVPHWIFAMADTLAINSARALALIVSHPEDGEQARSELQQQDLATAAGITQLNYLTGCLQEAMRLWPTTPLLVRETVRATELGGETIPAQTQVIISNSFNHRDRETHPFADRFAPEIWLEEHSDYHFNHLSNGKQSCAGKHLALFIGTAVLAQLLAGKKYQLLEPALDPGQPLPYRYNQFHLEFQTKE